MSIAQIWYLVAHLIFNSSGASLLEDVLIVKRQNGLKAWLLRRRTIDNYQYSCVDGSAGQVANRGRDNVKPFELVTHLS